MKYSVIIPVYNAEKTIGKCLDSLLCQPHDDAEILLINDGSADACGEICREYARNHACIRYFEKENGGVSTARNLGLWEAKGTYILFVDSDDYVMEHYFATITAALEKIRPDLLVFGIRSMGAVVRDWITGSYVVSTERAIARKTSRAARAYLFSNVMSKVFRRDLIRAHELKFDESLSIGEDQLFVFKYTMHVKKMASISDVLYCLVSENQESLSRKRRDYLAEQLLQVNCGMLEALDVALRSGGARKIRYNTVCWVHYRSAYSTCKELLKFDLTARERRRIIRQICAMYTIDEMKPRSLSIWIIAFPIIHRLSLVIEAMTIISFNRGRACSR